MHKVNNIFKMSLLLLQLQQLLRQLRCLTCPPLSLTPETRVRDYEYCPSWRCKKLHLKTDDRHIPKCTLRGGSVESTPARQISHVSGGAVHRALSPLLARHGRHCGGKHLRKIYRNIIVRKRWKHYKI